MKKEIIGCFLIALGVVVFVWLLYLNSVNPNTSTIFSESNMLNFIWKNYKSDYIEEGTGRTIDRQRGTITTSEGVAYTMLRAVWMDDKNTFDQSFGWANENLQREDDALYSWLYGKKDDGTYGVLSSQGGINTASDANIDIALSLIFAYRRWGEESYVIAAQKIISDIWKHEVVTIKGVPYLAANNIESLSEDRIIVNPSYFSPAAYRIFAEYDTVNPWMSLVESSYSLLTLATQDSLDTSTSAAIPPDWITVSKKNGTIIPNASSNLTTHFSYEALRVPWRIALDYVWFGVEESKIYLSRLGFLNSEWKTKGTLASVYAHNGQRIVETEAPAMYAGALGYFMLQDTKSAEEIYRSKLLFLYDSDTNDWKSPLSYYDDNMVWFALAMYNNLLPNLNAK